MAAFSLLKRAELFPTSQPSLMLRPLPEMLFNLLFSPLVSSHPSGGSFNVIPPRALLWATLFVPHTPHLPCLPALILPHFTLYTMTVLTTNLTYIFIYLHIIIAFKHMYIIKLDK